MVEFYKALFLLLGTLAWPVVVVYIVFSFKKEIDELLKRLKSAELVGAKITLNELGAGLIEDTIAEVVDQPDPKVRARLAEDIKKATVILGSIHPISLSILIQGVEHLFDDSQPVNSFTWEYYIDKKKYFDELNKSGLAKIQDRHDDEGMSEVSVYPTEKGKDLLKTIGVNSSP
jgi:hypothetical protein